MNKPIINRIRADLTVTDDVGLLPGATGSRSPTRCATEPSTDR
jgi:hypothetical protein